MNIDQEIDNLIAREGGYVNDQDDNGGPTKYGITQKTLENWLARTVTLEDVQNLSKKTAREIYYSWYYIKPGINELPAELQALMIDMAAHHGRRNAIKILQRALYDRSYLPSEKAIDGKIGPQTTLASRTAQGDMGRRLLKIIIARRVIFCENIVKRDPTQRKKLADWVARAESFLPEAIA